MFEVDKIREEFPILGCKVYGKPLVYLDSGATAQKPLQVIEAVDRLHREQNANIHRGVHFLSEEATELYEAARARIAAWIGAAAKEEIVFTSGATASLNAMLERKDVQMGYKLSAGNIGVSGKKVTLPLYLAGYLNS